MIPKHFWTEILLMLDFKLEIPFFDAKAAYSHQQEKLDNAIQRVLSHGSYINGPEVSAFALNLAEYLDIAQVVPCGNGTDALMLALMALELKKGDEVIIPAFNFVAAAEAVALLGLTPVFVDVDEASFNINASSFEQKINNKTKAIIVVHLFGLAAQMEQIVELAVQNNLIVIEDVAQALGGNYQRKKLGTIGHIGCTSFFPTKNLACFGDGGAVFTDNLDLAKKIKMLANHGQQQKYEHTYIGINSRLDTIQAAILNIQLKYLGPLIEKRRAMATYYLQNLKGISCISLPPESEDHTYNQFCILLANRALRDQLKAFLEKHGVGSMIYYPKATHLQPAFSRFGFKEGDFPVAERLCHSILALPIFPGLTPVNQAHIVALIRSFADEIK